MVRRSSHDLANAVAPPSVSTYIVVISSCFQHFPPTPLSPAQAIQSGLTVLMQMQDALWRDLPALKDPVLQTLSRINVDRHLLDQEVRKAMRTGAAKYLATRSVQSLACRFVWSTSFPGSTNVQY